MPAVLYCRYYDAPVTIGQWGLWRLAHQLGSRWPNRSGVVMIGSMRMSIPEIEKLAAGAMGARPAAVRVPWACAWLEACGYPGLKLLREALSEPASGWQANRDALGLDLANVSCVWIGDAVVTDVQLNGRVFLRNVRHGLYLLPFSVEVKLAIGCPVDPAFALGGVREKDPYAEKLSAAAGGLDIADDLIAGFNSIAPML